MQSHLPGMYVGFVRVLVSSNGHKDHNTGYYCDKKDCKDSCHHSTYDSSTTLRLTCVM